MERMHEEEFKALFNRNSQFKDLEKEKALLATIGTMGAMVKKILENEHNVEFLGRTLDYDESSKLKLDQLPVECEYEGYPLARKDDDYYLLMDLDKTVIVLHYTKLVK
tara:strand:- start:131282 stop:131605 length:324 start_codon:yes stop_codon:yes gene_type:complete